ncbi:MAG: META domain-containing protein [Brooklawnia sp.]|uniref:META domain-containing protein n=1 Tax=Brooklawnia sp. TaxID=2699740 RepID=UPI003C78B1A7
MRASSVFGFALVALLATACSTASPQSGSSPSGASPASPSPTASASPTPSPARSPGTASPASLLGNRWVLDELTDRQLVPGSVITAHLGTDQTLTGTSGCNRYRAQVLVESDGSIRVDEAIASTMMACEQALMDQEGAYLAALTSARSFTVAGERLTLRDADGAALAAFVPESQELAGTEWQVTAYHNGSSAVVGVLQDTTATIAFGSDGAISGTAGCNRLTGDFATTDDGAIDIGPLGTTRMMCVEPEGVMEQEAAILAALEAAASYAVEGDRLELRTTDEQVAVQLTRN